jgi:hypothetical protein
MPIFIDAVKDFTVIGVIAFHGRRSQGKINAKQLLSELTYHGVWPDNASCMNHIERMTNEGLIELTTMRNAVAYRMVS